MSLKLLPKGKWARLRMATLLGLLGWALVQFHVYGLAHLIVYHPQEGDIVFQSLPRGPLVDAIETITESPFSHCGVVIRDAKGRWVVSEAIGQVRETPLHLWIVRGRGARLDVWRWKDMPKHDPAQIHTALRHYLGRPYDFRYAPEDDEIYCSELVFKSYQLAYGVKLGDWERLGDLNWQPQEAFIREMENGALPLDRPMITPVGLTRSPLLEKAY